jgi:hypothetical protein
MDKEVKLHEFGLKNPERWSPIAIDFIANTITLMPERLKDVRSLSRD